MMRKFLPVVFSILISYTGFSQPFNNAKSFYRAGIDFKNKNMFAEAMASFKKAISLNKAFDSAYVEIGDLYVRTGRPDSGIIHYNKALSVNPKMIPALLSLGNVYRDVKPNYDSALSCYYAALKLDSFNKVTYYSIAWCYNAKADYEKAIPYAIKALEIDNNYKPAYGELGHAYRRTKKFTEAIEQFKKNIAVSKVDIPYFYSGMCYIELKNKEAALQQYEELRKINEKMAESLKKRIDAMQ